MKQYIGKVCEKIAFKIVESGNTEEILIDEGNIEEFIGTANYQSKKFYKVMPPGTVIGLAYNSHGGSILYIESSKASGRDSDTAGKVGTLKVTGQLGSVMQESSSIALTYARNFMSTHLEKDSHFLEEKDLHIHFPEGST